MRRWSFAKGHGTENDFVVVLDREAMLHLEESEVRYLCDRHAGIGADGLLRVVLAKHIPGWTGDPEAWFMDYRNADGSVAEMCGNGARVFVRYLLEEDLASGPVVSFGTRGGLREATMLPDGRVRVGLGPVSVGEDLVLVRTADGREHAARPVDVGNPHAVAFVDDLAELALHAAPGWTPAETFPDGANVEFVRRLGPGHVAMRVYERGVGETRSCGTGTVAAAAATRAAGDDTETFRVDVPGGSVRVDLLPDQAYLTGPAVIVAHGHVALPDTLGRAAG